MKARSDLALGYKPSTWSVVQLLVLVCLVAGCNQADDGRRGVSGGITVNGEPLESGRVVFRPLGGGQTAGAPIAGGEFRIAASPGVAPGEYRVEFKAMRETGKTFTDPESGTVEQERESYLPAKYGSESELTVEVSLSGDNRFEFNLEI